MIRFSLDHEYGNPKLDAVPDEDWDRIKFALQFFAQDLDDDSAPTLKGELHSSDGLDLM